MSDETSPEIERDREVKALDASGRLGTLGRYWINRNLPEFARQYFPASGLRVLDIGCGDGPYYELLRKAALAGEYLGIDIRESEFWKERGAGEQALHPTFKVWDAHRIDSLGRSFNAVISVTAFEHFRADRSVMKSVSRVLEPGGHALIIVPSPYGSLVWGFSHGFRKYTPRRFGNLLDDTELDLVEAVPAGAAPSLIANGLWFGASGLLGRAIRYGAYARYLGDRRAARAAHPWVKDAVARIQYGHLRYGLGRAIHGHLNDALYAADEQVKLCPTQWLFVLRRRS
ncbi:MAG: class I SAM-dependent methyltransferase [Myxococcota bacterium]|nr:class I SAM-dependent methyltransferase [Myxococcota bacterium]